jgi:hypothetical protein
VSEIRGVIRIPVVSQAFGLKVTFTVLDCAICAGVFAITDDFDARRRYDGATFYCPIGHSNSYSGEQTKLRERAERLEQQAARLSAEVDQERAARAFADRQRAAAQGQVTRLRKRVQNGVCVECHRSFSNLQRHMNTKHGANASQTGGM